MSKTITVSEETYESIKDQLGDDTSYEINELDSFIGKKIFIRTVTYHMIGKVENRIGNLFELSGASWVADSGQFTAAIKDGTLDEVEIVGQQWVNIETIVDMFPWKHKLPTQRK